MSQHDVEDVAAELPGLLMEADGPVVRLTLNRPDRRNALSESLLAELEAALSDLANDSQARVVVIAAAGPVFSSGHDLSEMSGRDEAAYQNLFGRCTRVMQGTAVNRRRMEAYC